MRAAFIILAVVMLIYALAMIIGPWPVILIIAAVLLLGIVGSSYG